MSRDIQNEKYFAIMTDESADTANEEQLVICFRCVEKDFEINEDLLEFIHYQIQKLTVLSK